MSTNPPHVIRSKGLDVQVCVPLDWNDEQVIEFAEKSNPCGTENGWQIRKQPGGKLIGDETGRVQCTKFDKMVHIVLDA